MGFQITNWATRLVSILAQVEGGSQQSVPQITQYGEWLTRAKPRIDDIASHSFSVSGLTVTFDPNFVDLEDYHFWAVWTENQTKTAPINRVQSELAENTGGGGLVVQSQLITLPAFVNPDVFLTTNTSGLFNFDFNNSQTFLLSAFRSVRVGYLLLPPGSTAQTVVAHYKGIRYF